MKKKYLQPIMEFKPGLMKYEPKLPLPPKKRGNPKEIKNELWKLILILIFLLLGSLVVILFLRRYG
jgi:hypothetical protein